MTYFKGPYSLEHKGKTYKLKNFKRMICNNCGKEVYGLEEAQRIEEIILTQWTATEYVRSAIMESDIFEVIETALTRAGYKILDGNNDSIIVRHKNSDYDYEIKVNEVSDWEQ